MIGHKKFLALSHIVLILVTILAVVPFWLLIVASFTNEKYAINNGYSFWPGEFSLDAYKYLLNQWELFGRGYGITIIVSIIGVILCLIITMSIGYMLSKDGLPGRKFFNYMVVFTMLFNGGLVATYINYTQYFHIKDTLFALLVPNLITNAFYIFMTKNFFQQNIPEEIIEAARIDGCSEFKIYFEIVIKLSKPMIATLALLSGVMYWNDWQNGMYYLDDSKLYGIQNILNAINMNAQYLKMIGRGSNMPTETVRMAAAAIGIIPIMLVYPFFQDYFVKGMTMGAVKG
jgi:putative aldouronate transport system permease protein